MDPAEASLPYSRVNCKDRLFGKTACIPAQLKKAVRHFKLYFISPSWLQKSIFQIEKFRQIPSIVLEFLSSSNEVHYMFSNQIKSVHWSKQ